MTDFVDLITPVICGNLIPTFKIEVFLKNTTTPLTLHPFEAVVNELKIVSFTEPITKTYTVKVSDVKAGNLFELDVELEVFNYDARFVSKV